MSQYWDPEKWSDREDYRLEDYVYDPVTDDSNRSDTSAIDGVYLPQRSRWLGRPRPRPTQNPERDYDDLDVKLGLITQQQLDSLQSPTLNLSNPLDKIESVKFVWNWRTTGTGSTRNQLTFGQLHTKTQKMVIWGFRSAAEFKDHLHPDDLKQACRELESVNDDLQQMSTKIDEYSRTFWVCRDDTGQTRSGFWAITIDVLDHNKRIFYIMANGKIQLSGPRDRRPAAQVTIE